MSSNRRSPLTSIENVALPEPPEEIELREVNEPLLTLTEDTSDHPAEHDEEPNETSPLSPNSDIDHDETEVTFRPAPPDDSTLTQRRRSSSRLSASNQPADRRAGGLQQTIREFLADLLPADDRNAWRVPIAIFAIFVLFVIAVITCVVLGYTTVDYDEFGVTHNLMTGVMDLKNPYSAGVYLILPWERMILFDKTARYLNFNALTIFTTDQASIILDASVVYRIRPQQIEPIWLNFADKHETILRLVAENILRNHGNQFSIYDYRARREHVEHRLSRTLQQTLSGDCCPICCHTQTCSKTIEFSCPRLIHCNDSKQACSNGYFVDIDAVYIFKVALPSQIIKRLYTLMLMPIYTEIAESQQNAAVVWIETEKLRNQLLNRAREVLMSALAENELLREKARVKYDSVLLTQLSTSEKRLFHQLKIQPIAKKLSVSFLLELAHLTNLTHTVDLDGIITEAEEPTAQKPAATNDLFDFVPASNVFDLTEFLSILEN